MMIKIAQSLLYRKSVINDVKKNIAALIGALVLVFAIPYANAQEIEFSGYLEPQIMVVKQGDDWLQLSSNRLRAEASSELSEQITFNANVIFLTYHGKKDWNFLDYIPKNLKSQIPKSSHALFDFAYQDTIFLDNAFLKIRLKQFDLTIGKQQLSFGTGYAWNPTNLFNVKNITDPTYEQPGKNAIRSDISLTERSSITLLVQVKEKLDRSAAFVRWTFPLLHLDVSAVAAQKYWTLGNYQTFDFSAQKRQMFGVDFAGELIGLGVWGEFGRNIMGQSKDFSEILFGADYTWESGFYFMAEFYHNSLAKSNWKTYSVSDWMRYINGEVLTVTKNQTYIHMSYPATDLIDISLSSIVSVSDKSAAFIPTLRYSWFQNLTLTVIGQVYTGKSGTAFGKNLGDGGLMRARLFF